MMEHMVVQLVVQVEQLNHLSYFMESVNKRWRGLVRVSHGTHDGLESITTHVFIQTKWCSLVLVDWLLGPPHPSLSGGGADGSMHVGLAPSSQCGQRGRP